MGNEPRKKLTVFSGDKSNFIPTRFIDWRGLINYPESF